VGAAHGYQFPKKGSLRAAVFSGGESGHRYVFHDRDSVFSAESDGQGLP
jgi:hypothetical protein